MSHKALIDDFVWQQVKPILSIDQVKDIVNPKARSVEHQRADNSFRKISKVTYWATGVLDIDVCSILSREAV